jgi:hypothetical protein
MKAPKKENPAKKIERRKQKYFNFSIFLFFVFGIQNLKAQVGLQVSNISLLTAETVEFAATTNYVNSEPHLLGNSDHPAVFHPLREFFQPPQSDSDVNSKAYVFEHESFFCRLEFQMEKKVKVLFPLKFRLGEFNYEERLEGKRPLNLLRN